MKLMCQFHPNTELGELYLNKNFAKKLKHDGKTELFYCILCGYPVKLNMVTVEPYIQKVFKKKGKHSQTSVTQK